jgi:hypothetical protein
MPDWGIELAHIVSGGASIFVNEKQAKNGNPYLHISRKTRGRQAEKMFLFPDQLEELLPVLMEVAEKWGLDRPLIGVTARDLGLRCPDCARPPARVLHWEDEMPILECGEEHRHRADAWELKEERDA